MLTKKINFATASNILIKRKNNIFKRPNNIFLWNTIKLFKRPNNIFYGTQLNCLSAQIILSQILNIPWRGGYSTFESARAVAKLGYEQGK